MITRENLPKSYKPYTTLVVCSNTITGGGHILAIGDVIPVLVGSGDKPQIWLQALSNPEKNEFVTIVEASISKHPAVRVFEVDGTLNVHVGSTNVLTVKATNETAAEIILMDLRPLGISLYGNSSELKVGNSTFSRNSFSGGGTMIGFGNSTKHRLKPK
jgi:hypothetical protein